MINFIKLNNPMPDYYTTLLEDLQAFYKKLNLTKLKILKEKKHFFYTNCFYKYIETKFTTY